MQDISIENKCKKYLVYLCLIQVTFWTIIPYLANGVLPFDTAESISWGQQWMLSYTKHPPLCAWITTLFYNIGGSFAVYFLAQLAVIICFIAIWKLARYYFSAPLALLCVVLIEGNFAIIKGSPSFNPNSILVPLWAIQFLTFYIALKKQNTASWLWFGFWTALSMLGKYQTAILFFPMLLIMLFTPEGRSSFKNKGMYIGLIFCILITLPHFYASYQHGFPEIQYALGRTVEQADLINHFKMPFKSFLNQLGNVAIIIVIALPLIFAKNRVQLTVGRFDKYYLFMMALGPFATTLLMSAISGSNIGNNWFVPFFSMIGMVIIYFARPVLTKKNITAFCILLGIAFFGILLGRNGDLMFTPYFTGKVDSKAYFPGKDVAMKAEEVWHQHYQQPLEYVAGDNRIVSFINVYAPNHPKPLDDWSLAESPWINMHTFKQKGALFVWYAKNKYDTVYSMVNADQMPSKIQKEFPNARYLGIYHFKPAVLFGHYDDIRIGMAILPPQQSSEHPFSQNDQ